MADLHVVTIQLLVVPESPRFLEALGVPRQKCFKSRMALTKYTFVKQTKYCNIPSELRRCKIMLQKCFRLGDVKFVQEVALYLPDFVQQGGCSVEVGPAVAFNEVRALMRRN